MCRMVAGSGAFNPETRNQSRERRGLHVTGEWIDGSSECRTDSVLNTGGTAHNSMRPGR